MTRIVKCRVENILGVKEVEFEPNGQSVTIGGSNGQGKSSAIWGLVMALGGRHQLPKEPVRQGEEKGSVVVETEKFIVRFDVNADNKTKLVVESADGARYQSPQGLLNECFGRLSFDPGAFRLMDQKKRVETLLDLIGVDLADFDLRENVRTQERREIGRTVKELEAKLDGTMYDPELPTEEVSAAELMKTLDEALEHNAKVDRHVRDLESLMSTIGVLEDRIATLEADLKQAIERRDNLNERLKSQSSESPVMMHTDPIRDQIASVDNRNQAIRKNLETKQRMDELADRRAAYAKKTEKLEAIRKERQAALEAAKMPIEGLSFEDGDVTFNGVPFEQISESQQWEVSTAIGFGLNPKGVLFMRNSGGLDKKSRERIRARAADLGVQLFLEVVDDAEDVQLLIEEGFVKENRLNGVANEQRG